MKKLKVILSGRGAEVYTHTINEGQKQLLKEMDVENQNVSIDFDKLGNVLQKDWDDCDKVYMGAYDDPSYYHVVVLDENDEIIWESDETNYLETGSSDEDYQDIQIENCLIIENSLKGEFAEYVLEVEDKFDPNKFEVQIVEINESITMITGLKYDGKALEIEEYGDNWSKGAFFSIF